MKTSLPILNIDEARFECIYGRGCEGLCCQNGRPGVYPEEEQRLRKNLKKFLPELRPDARKVLEKLDFVSKRRKDGLPMLRVVAGWCIFFQQGCVLHKVGAAEGDKYRYKPAPCALFPVSRTEQGDWYVRQKGIQSESWNLFCLDPAATKRLAAETLAEEIGLAQQYTEQEQAPKPARRRAARPRTKQAKPRRKPA